MKKEILINIIDELENICHDSYEILDLVTNIAIFSKEHNIQPVIDIVNIELQKHQYEFILRNQGMAFLTKIEE